MMFPPSQLPRIISKEARLIEAADDELSNLTRFLHQAGDFSAEHLQSPFRFYDLAGDPLSELAALTISAIHDWLHAHLGVGRQTDAERSVRTQAVALFFSTAGTHLASRRQHFRHQRGTAEQRKLLLRFEVEYLNQRYDAHRPNGFVSSGVEMIPKAVQAECIAIASEPHSLSLGLASDHLRDALLKELHHLDGPDQRWMHLRAPTNNPPHHPPHNRPHKSTMPVTDTEEEIIRREYGHLGLQRTYRLNNSLFSYDPAKSRLERHISFFNDFRSYLSDPSGFSRIHDPHVASLMEMAASEALRQEQALIPTGHSMIISNIPLRARMESAQVFRRQANDLPRRTEETRRMIAAFHMYADFVEDPSPSNSYALSNPLAHSLISQFVAHNGVELSYASALSIQYANNPSTKRAVDRIVSYLGNTNSLLKGLQARPPGF